MPRFGFGFDSSPAQSSRARSHSSLQPGPFRSPPPPPPPTPPENILRQKFQMSFTLLSAFLFHSSKIPGGRGVYLRSGQGVSLWWPFRSTFSNGANFAYV